VAIVLALAASVSWGFADFWAGLKSRTLPVLTVMAVSQAAGLTTIAVIVAVRGEGPPGGDFAVFAALGALGGLGGLAAFYRGLSIGAMSVVAPISGLAAAVPVVFGLLQGERPSALQGTGIVVALAGVVLAAREKAPEHESGTRTAAGTGLALVAALGFGSFFVALDQASEPDALWAILANRIAGVSILVLACLALRPALRLARPDLGALAVVGVLDMGANGMYALATRHGLLSVVSVLVSIYPVVVVALAHAVLRERLRPSQAAGAAAALAGVAMIVAG